MSVILIGFVLLPVLLIVLCGVLYVVAYLLPVIAVVLFWLLGCLLSVAWFFLMCVCAGFCHMYQDRPRRVYWERQKN